MAKMVESVKKHSKGTSEYNLYLLDESLAHNKSLERINKNL